MRTKPVAVNALESLNESYWQQQLSTLL